MSLKLFIWEGGISSGYHDDGTLVVLAESVEQAREIVQAEAEAIKGDDDRKWNAPGHLWDLDTAVANIDRDPERVIDATSPAFVAFNGGGYD